MREQKQIEAIARLEGIYDLKYHMHNIGGNCVYNTEDGVRYVSNYLISLDAVQPVINNLSEKMTKAYCIQLGIISKRVGLPSVKLDASKRAEAVIKAFGLWVSE